MSDWRHRVLISWLSHKAFVSKSLIYLPDYFPLLGRDWSHRHVPFLGKLSHPSQMTRRFRGSMPKFIFMGGVGFVIGCRNNLYHQCTHQSNIHDLQHSLLQPCVKNSFPLPVLRTRTARFPGFYSTQRLAWMWVLFFSSETHPPVLFSPPPTNVMHHFFPGIIGTLCPEQRLFSIQLILRTMGCSRVD